MKTSNPIRFRSEGFTIIEVLIVLAVAGLLFLMIFEAIPALERNNRNSQRKNDIAMILGAVSHYALNDSGNFPLDCGGGGGYSPCTSVAGGSNNDYFLRFNANKIIYYSSSNIELRGLSTSATVSVTPTVEQVYVYNYQKCLSNGTGRSTPQGAGYNDVVALFAVETGNGYQLQCEQM